MDYEICFLVCGNRASALGLQKAVGCFLCEKSLLFCFCERAQARARACRSHGNMRAGRAAHRRAGHTLGFVSALLSQISSHITKAIKGQESGGLLHGSSKNCHILSILHSGVFHSFMWRYLWPSIWESPKTAY